MQNILFVLWSGNLGGAERHVLDILSALPQEKWKPTVCFLTRALEMAKILSERSTPFFEIGMRNGLDFWALRKMRKPLRCGNFQIIHEHGGNKIAVISYKLFSPRSRLFFTIHNGEFPKEYHRLRLLGETFKMKNFNQLICVSHTLSVAWGNFLKRNVLCIRNGIDLSKFKIKEERPPRNRLVTVGRLIPTKNTDLLIRLLDKTLKNEHCELWIAGEGPERDKLQALIHELALENRVRLLGQVSDIPGLLSQTTIFVSASRVENCSLALMEAAAAGLPSVIAKNAGAAEIVQENETGFVIPEKALQGDFASKVELLLQNEHMRRRFAQNARRLALAKFNRDEMLQKIFALYNAEAAS